MKRAFFPPQPWIVLFIRPSDVTKNEHELRQFSNPQTVYFRLLLYLVYSRPDRPEAAGRHVLTARVQLDQPEGSGQRRHRLHNEGNLKRKQFYIPTRLA